MTAKEVLAHCEAYYKSRERAVTNQTVPAYEQDEVILRALKVLALVEKMGPTALRGMTGCYRGEAECNADGRGELLTTLARLAQGEPE